MLLRTDVGIIVFENTVASFAPLKCSIPTKLTKTFQEVAAPLALFALVAFAQ